MSKMIPAGIVTAYGAAVRGGYLGTYEEFCTALGDLARVLEEFEDFSVTVETLEPGSSATASYNSGVLALGIPAGETGNGIASAVLNQDYTLTLTWTNGQSTTVGPIRGATGQTPNLTIGTVQTLQPSQPATATITGTPENPVLNLGIPKGESGGGDAGDITFDPEEDYDEGTVGAELSSQKNAIDQKAPVIINTASGDIATFADGANGMPIKHLVASIEAVQEGSGDPSPTNVRPITGWTGLIGARTGKNLYDGTVVNMAYDGDHIVSGSNYRGIYSRIVGGNTYTVSRKVIESNRFRVVATAEIPAADVKIVGTPVDRDNDLSATITVPETANYLFVYLSNQSDTILPNNYQFEIGSTATEYESFTEQTISVSWASEAGTVYGGTLDVVTGVLTITHAKKHLVASDFTSYFDTYKQASGSNLLSDAPAYYDFTAATYYCDMFKPVSNQSRADYIGNYAVLLSSGLTVGFSANVSSLEEFKALIPNGIDFVYRLATPQTYQLDPITVNTLLGNNTIYVDCGSVSVDYPADTGIVVAEQSNAIEQKQDATNYVTLSGTIVTQTGADNTMYLCGELAELTFTAPATGQAAIRFTSGTTPTVATFSGVTWLNGFDPTAIEASKTYEINILNGLGCAAWT